MSQFAVPSTIVCPAHCGAAVEQVFELAGYRVYRCTQCGVEILAARGAAASTEGLDRSQFEGALESLRMANYRRVLSKVSEHMDLKRSRVLDVGCSSGWFLSLAQAAWAQVYGVEPDAYFYEQAVQRFGNRGHLAHGAFPEALPQDWCGFDAISFHDVFEHLPDPARMLAAARERLSSNGLLVLSLPMSDGFTFRTATLLYRLGLRGGLERMFQVHYPFPHLFYFNTRSIESLARLAGFAPLHVGRLRSFSFSGSLKRARMDLAVGFAGRMRQYASAAVLMAFALLEPLLPADSALVILRRQPS